MKRDFDRVRQRERAVEEIKDMLAEQGVQEPDIYELTRTAYAMLLDIGVYRQLQTRELQEKERQVLALQNDLSLSSEEREARLQRVEKITSREIDGWKALAAGIEKYSVEYMKRDTGITDAVFYERLFAVKLTTAGSFMDTTMQDNELMFEE